VSEPNPAFDEDFQFLARALGNPTELKEAIETLRITDDLERVLTQTYKNGRTFLHYAPALMPQGEDNPEIVELLLNALKTDEAESRALSAKDVNGWTFFTWVTALKKPNIFRWLMEEVKPTEEVLDVITSCEYPNPGIRAMKMIGGPLKVHHPPSPVLAFAALNDRSFFQTGESGDDFKYVTQIDDALRAFLDRIEPVVPGIKGERLTEIYNSTSSAMSIILQDGIDHGTGVAYLHQLRAAKDAIEMLTDGKGSMHQRVTGTYAPPGELAEGPDHDSDETGIYPAIDYPEDDGHETGIFDAIDNHGDTEEISIFDPPSPTNTAFRNAANDNEGLKDRARKRPGPSLRDEFNSASGFGRRRNDYGPSRDFG